MEMMVQLSPFPAISRAILKMRVINSRLFLFFAIDGSLRPMGTERPPTGKRNWPRSSLTSKHRAYLGGTRQRQSPAPSPGPSTLADRLRKSPVDIFWAPIGPLIMRRQLTALPHSFSRNVRCVDGTPEEPYFGVTVTFCRQTGVGRGCQAVLPFQSSDDSRGYATAKDREKPSFSCALRPT